MTRIMPTAIQETPVTGLPGRTPRESIEAPLTGGREIEPALLLDVSSSNEEAAGPDSDMTKHQLVEVALPLLVGSMEGDDSQAKNEESGGGVRGFAFSDRNAAQDLDDLNTARIKEQLKAIRWGGMTYAMDAVRMAEAAYQEEFGDRPLRNRPALELAILTDGMLNDADEFEAWVAQADETCVICAAIIGYGTGHDRAVEHYQKIAKGNKFVTVDALTGVSDPTEIAFDLRLLMGLA
jgi:hypothetical protein